MLGLPKSTEFNKRIPKKKFYEQLEVTPDIKRIFVEQIKNIIWRNKIAPSTVNIAEGEKITEIEVFEVQLTAKNLDEKVLRLIDQGISYPIVFVLHHELQIQIWMAFKEAQNVKGPVCKVITYYYTDWVPEDSYTLDITGLTIDQVYENLIRKIAGTILTNHGNESIKESISRIDKINLIKNKIKNIHLKMRKEKQFNKKVKLNENIRILMMELQKLENGKNEDGIC